MYLFGFITVMFFYLLVRHQSLTSKFDVFVKAVKIDQTTVKYLISHLEKRMNKSGLKHEDFNEKEYLAVIQDAMRVNKVK